MGMREERKGFELQGMGLMVLAGAWLAGMVMANSVALAAGVWLVGTGAALLVCIGGWREQRVRWLAGVLVLLFLGGWRYTIETPREQPRSLAHLVGMRGVHVRGEVAAEPTTTGHSRSLLITAREVSSTGASWQPAQGELSVVTLGETIIDPYGANYGDEVELTGTLQPGPGGPSAVAATMTFPRVHVSAHGGNPLLGALFTLRVTLSQLLASALPQPEAALLIAIFLSLHTPSLTLLKADFNSTGTAHLVAASGFKITLLAGLLAQALSRLYEDHVNGWQVLPAQRRKDWRRWLATLLVLGCIGGYTLLSGASPAALRAGIMGSLLYLTPRLERRYNVYTALAGTALVMSMIDPFLAWDIGFQLSFVGTLGILLLTPALTRILQPLRRLPGGGYLSELLAVTLAAQIVTLPIVAVTFHVVSLVAPLANLLTVPLLGALLVLGALLCAIGILSPLLLQRCGELAWPLVHYVAVVIPWCAHIPWSALNVGSVDTLLVWFYYALLGTLYYLWAQTQWQAISKAQVSSYQGGKQHGGTQRIPPKVRLLMVTLIVLAYGLSLFQAQAQASTNQAEVIFIDLGSPAQPEAGTAIFLRSVDGHSSLIDGGLDSAGVGLALDRLLSPWQRTLDTVMLTAPLQNHITGLQDVAARYTIGRAVDAGMLHPSATYARWRRTISTRAIPYVVAQQGSVIPSGASMQIQVLWPLELHKGSDEARDNSLVLRLTAPGLNLLLLGEAATSKYALQGLLDDIDPTYLQADIVQVVDNANKPFPQILASLLEKIHPAQLIVTPGAPRRGAGQQASSTSSEELSALLSRDSGGLLSNLVVRVIAQTGTLTLHDTGQGWQSVTESDSFSSS